MPQNRLNGPLPFQVSSSPNICLCCYRGSYSVTYLHFHDTFESSFDFRHNGVHTVMLSICTSHVKKRACHVQMSLSNSQHDDVVGRNHTVMHVPAMLKRACVRSVQPCFKGDVSTVCVCRTHTSHMMMRGTRRCSYADVSVQLTR